MEQSMYSRIVENGLDPAACEQTIVYLAEHLGKFLKKKERVLICFSDNSEGSLGWVMEQAACRCDAVPVMWGPDRRWKTLLQQAFYSRASAIIGPPLILLGLTKLIKYNKTPLYIRKVITAGYPCLDWMIEGIVKGLDCEVGGCFTLGESAVVAGFACGRSWGIHLREDVYGVEIVDRAGSPLPAGELGEVVLFPKNAPELRHPMGELARMEPEVCGCGSSAVRLLDFCPGWLEPKDLVELRQFLHSWTSILDCRVARGESGLEIEIVCFPGEKLPQLPTAAKLVIRPWNAKNDEPFPYNPAVLAAQRSWMDGTADL